MLGYYEACADHCGPCGTSCSHLMAAHATWIARQYASTRVLATTGQLVLGARCLDATLALADCGTAARWQLDPAGALHIGDQCLAANDAGALALSECTGDPGQYWMHDDEGFLWNGLSPQIGRDMAF